MTIIKLIWEQKVFYLVDMKYYNRHSPEEFKQLSVKNQSHTNPNEAFHRAHSV